MEMMHALRTRKWRNLKPFLEGIDHDLQPAKSQDDTNKCAMQQWNVQMPENEDWHKEDNNVHYHIPDLGREGEPSDSKETFCSRNCRVPLRRKGNATNHAHDNENGVPST